MEDVALVLEKVCDGDGDRPAHALNAVNDDLSICAGSDCVVNEVSRIV